MTGSTQFGNFYNFCRDSTLPVCNLFSDPATNPQRNQAKNGGCALTGISLSGERELGNLGSILLCGLAIAITLFLLWRSERKQAAVGRREMQLFLIGYIVIEICEIFTVGEFPLQGKIRVGFTGVHLGAIVATTWILMLNAVVGFQILEDGTPVSLGLIVASATALFIGTGYIALDTGYAWTGHFGTFPMSAPYQNYGLYVLYQLMPIVFLFVFFVLEVILVIRVLQEKKPMIPLALAALFFIIGQIFNYVISVHICNGTNGKIDGALFETFFTLLAVVTIWYFWSSITEDDWPEPANTYPQ